MVDLQSFLGKRWKLPTVDDALVLTYQEKFSLSKPLAMLLASREIPLEEVGTFLNPRIKESLPDPFSFKDMDKAVSLVIEALTSNKKIMILGDYDVDGATSTALLCRFLRYVGAEVDFHIPDRFEEGYGPSVSIFQKFIREGAQVAITVDCGTTADEALLYAKNEGLSVIVIDHHQVPSPTLPPTAALINPYRPDAPHRDHYVAAVGMTFLFLVAAERILRKEKWYEKKGIPPFDLLRELDLVALGTVCDVMPLKGVNRAFVAQGLKVIAEKGKPCFEEMKLLLGASQEMSTYVLGFIFGPRINAGGRTGESRLGTELLLSDDPEKACALLGAMNVLNEERRAIEKEMLQEAMFLAESDPHQERPFLCLESEGWHAGVIGIVAGRLKDRYYKPTLLIAFDKEGLGKGSARSVGEIDIGALVFEAKEKGLLLNGGGHAAAAGLSLTKDQYLGFVAYLDEKLKGMSFIPSLKVDAILPLKALNEHFLNELEKLAPFGVANPEPRFLFSSLRVLHALILKEEHIKCTLEDEAGNRIIGMAFRAAQTPLGDALMAKGRKPLDLVGTLKKNVWNGVEMLQLIIEDGRDGV